MTGLEIAVLVPLVYGVVHLGKKVWDQSKLLTVQQETIQQHAEKIAQLQQPPERRAAPKILVAAGVLLGAALAFKWWQRQSERSSRLPPASYSPRDAMKSEQECILCLHHCRDTLVEPCHHFALCWPCAEQLEREVGRCPVCRAEITSIRYTFVV
jgi:hypothetical protein